MRNELERRIGSNYAIEQIGIVVDGLPSFLAGTPNAPTLDELKAAYQKAVQLGVQVYRIPYYAALGGIFSTDPETGEELVDPDNAMKAFAGRKPEGETILANYYLLKANPQVQEALRAEALEKAQEIQ